MTMQEKRQDKAKENGVITGYEPNKLKDIILKSNPLIYGNPGIGLRGSDFDEGNIKVGQKGELGFAKILQEERLLNKFQSFWSVQFPDINTNGPDTKLSGDIDCVLIGKNKVYLIDVKLYCQGDITWKMYDENKIIAVDNITQNWIGYPRTLSKNMKFATERIKNKFLEFEFNYDVESYIVFMPTDRGIVKIDNVFWPGEIQAMILPDLLKYLKEDTGFNPDNQDSQYITKIFKWLIKDESGKAKTFNENKAF